MKIDITKQPPTLAERENRRRSFWQIFYFSIAGFILSIFGVALLDDWEQSLSMFTVATSVLVLIFVLVKGCDLDYINEECCAIVADWLPKHPVLASYMREVNNQQRELMSSEYWAMATYVEQEEIKKKKSVLYKTEYNSSLQ